MNEWQNEVISNLERIKAKLLAIDELASRGLDREACILLKSAPWFINEHITITDEQITEFNKLYQEGKRKGG